MPQVKLEPMEVNFGGDFIVFAANASAEFDMNTLSEANPQYIKASGYVNLLNKLEVDATLEFESYAGDDSWTPDRIYFALGSDMIGLMPPLPIIEISKLGGGFNNLGKTFNKETAGWNYVPPLSFDLNVDAELNLFVVGLGIEGAGITLGPSILELHADAIEVKALTLMKDLYASLSWDLSAGRAVTNGFNLSLPIITYAIGGKVDVSVADTPLRDFIVGTGDLAITIDCDLYLKHLLGLLENQANFPPGELAAVKKKVADWITANGSKKDKDYIGLAKILKYPIKRLGSTFVPTMTAGVKVYGNATGALRAPDNWPIIGGYTVASGTASMSMLGPYFFASGSGTIRWLNWDVDMA
jgi:hypothetical protein